MDVLNESPEVSNKIFKKNLEGNSINKKYSSHLAYGKRSQNRQAKIIIFLRLLGQSFDPHK